MCYVWEIGSVLADKNYYTTMTSNPKLTIGCFLLSCNLVETGKNNFYSTEYPCYLSYEFTKSSLKMIFRTKSCLEVANHMLNVTSISVVNH